MESVGKTLPIVLKKLDITFYPEGGDLLPGIDNMVYFEALRPDGEPIDVEGYIVLFDPARPHGVASPEKLAVFNTEHEGRGSFNLRVPAEREVRAGASFAAIIASPVGIADPVPLPAVRVSLSAHPLPAGACDEVKRPSDFGLATVHSPVSVHPYG